MIVKGCTGKMQLAYKIHKTCSRSMYSEMSRSTFLEGAASGNVEWSSSDVVFSPERLGVKLNHLLQYRYQRVE